MRKTFNLRLPFIAACALVTGIVFAAVLAYFGLSGIFILIPAVILLAACALFAVLRRRVYGSLIFILIFVFFVVGALYTYCEYVSFLQSEAPLGELALVKGTVAETGFTSGGERYIIISHAEAYGTPLKGKLYALLADNAGDYCRRGYTVEFYTTLEKQNFIEYGAIGYQATKGVKYYCFVYGGLRSEYHFSLFGEIANALENTLYSSLDSETASVCLAMLTGNTDGISQGTLSSFRNGGIAHVFAVSGLHIGVIYEALTFLFKRTRVNRFVSVVVRIAFITAYSGVCNFTPSSVRALIMCSVSALANCFYRKYDGLNGLSVAAILLLLINPLALFQVGFTLSFGAMLGINFLCYNLKKIFSFLPRKLADAFAVGWSAQFGTVPALATAFGSVSLAGILLNIVFVPLVSAVYVLLFACSVISVVAPFTSTAILPVAALPIQLIINFVAFCGFENAVVTGIYSDWLFVPFVLVAIGFTDKINLRVFLRVALVFFSVLAVIFSAVVSSGRSGTHVTFTAGYEGGAAYVGTRQGNILIVTQDYVARTEYDCDDINALVVLGDDDNLSVMLRLGGKFEQVCMRGGAIGIPEYGPVSVVYADKFETCGVCFEYATDGNILNVTVEGVTFAIISEDKGAPYGEALQPADYNLYCYNGGCVLFTGSGSYDLSKCGNLRFETEGGESFPSFVVPKE